MTRRVRSRTECICVRGGNCGANIRTLHIVIQSASCNLGAGTFRTLNQKPSTSLPGILRICTSSAGSFVPSRGPPSRRAAYSLVRACELKNMTPAPQGIPNCAERILPARSANPGALKGFNMSSPGQEAPRQSVGAVRRIDALGFYQTAKLSPPCVARLPLAPTKEIVPSQCETRMMRLRRQPASSLHRRGKADVLRGRRARALYQVVNSWHIFSDVIQSAFIRGEFTT